MTLATIALMFIAGFFSGAVNAIAGGGTFLTFGVLTLAGLPAVVANATSSIIQFPGYITSTLAYFKDFGKLWKEALVLGLVSIVGSLFGALYLVWLSNNTFKAMVPWLLLAATVVFAAGPWLRPGSGGERHAVNPVGISAQAVTSFYGGFFGAGMGILTLAALSIQGFEDIQEINALKNLTSAMNYTVAALTFVVAGAISWPHTLVALVTAAIGGYVGAALARKLPAKWLKRLVIAVGAVLTVIYFIKTY